MFEARLPARKFASYKCVGVLATVDEDARKSIEHEKEVEVLKNEKVMTETEMASKA